MCVFCFCWFHYWLTLFWSTPPNTLWPPNPQLIPTPLQYLHWLLSWVHNYMYMGKFHKLYLHSGCHSCLKVEIIVTKYGINTCTWKKYPAKSQLLLLFWGFMNISLQQSWYSLGNNCHWSPPCRPAPPETKSSWPLNLSRVPWFSTHHWLPPLCQPSSQEDFSEGHLWKVSDTTAGWVPQKCFKGKAFHYNVVLSVCWLHIQLMSHETILDKLNATPLINFNHSMVFFPDN